MKYVGGKSLIAKDIIPFLLKGNSIENTLYVEPFCGGLGTMDKIPFRHKIAADNNKYLIALWKALQSGERFNEDITKEMHDKAKEDLKKNTNNHYSDAEIGWIGFAASYRGIFCSGHVKEYEGRNYLLQQINNIKRQLSAIKNIKFICCDYKDLQIPARAVIYCDPPYRGTTGYAFSKGFNHEEFYNWCRMKKKEGHQIFVSEYWMPNDFECVWQKQKLNSLASRTGKSKYSVERLYVL